MVFEEHDPRALRVLLRALRSTSRVTRLRAVSMLANVDCRDRTEWLEAACSDADEGVAQTALGVLSWVAQAGRPALATARGPPFRPCRLAVGRRTAVGVDGCAIPLAMGVRGRGMA